MRAILVKDGKGPVENLYLGETETPTPGPGKVLVKVRDWIWVQRWYTDAYTQVKVFGLNRMDILQREGRYPLPPGASPILGVEFSGTVAEVGQGVAEWHAGDEVLGLASGVGRPPSTWARTQTR